MFCIEGSAEECSIRLHRKVGALNKVNRERVPFFFFLSGKQSCLCQGLQQVQCFLWALLEGPNATLSGQVCIQHPIAHGSTWNFLTPSQPQTSSMPLGESNQLSRRLFSFCKRGWHCLFRHLPAPLGNHSFIHSFIHQITICSGALSCLSLFQ